MPLKRFKTEPGVIDIRSLSMPKAEKDRQGENFFDPEKEITAQEWQNILDYIATLAENVAVNKHDFMEAYIIINLALPAHTKELENLFREDMDIALALSTSAPAVSAPVRYLFRKIMYTDYSPEQEDWFIDTCVRQANKEHNLFDVIALVILHPKKIKEITTAFKKYFSEMEHAVFPFLALKKILIPEEFSAEKYTPEDLAHSRASIHQAFSDLNFEAISFMSALRLLIYTKILTLKKVEITAQGFVEGAPKAEVEFSEGLPPQPAVIEVK